MVETRRKKREELRVTPRSEHTIIDITTGEEVEGG